MNLRGILNFWADALEAGAKRVEAQDAGEPEPDDDDDDDAIETEGTEVT